MNAALSYGMFEESYFFSYYNTNFFTISKDSNSNYSENDFL